MTTCNVFVYGTLKEPFVQQAVIGRKVETEPATLVGYQLFSLRSSGEIPILVPEACAVCEGVLIHDITPEELAALDRYECVSAGLYQRVTVELEDAQYADVFVAPDNRSGYTPLPAGTTSWKDVVGIR